MYSKFYLNEIAEKYGIKHPDKREQLNKSRTKAKHITFIVRFITFFIICGIANFVIEEMNNSFVAESQIALVGWFFLIILIFSVIFLPKMFVPSKNQFREWAKEVEQIETEYKNKQREISALTSARLQIINFLEKYLYNRYKYELFGKYINFDEILITPNLIQDIEIKANEYPYNQLPSLKNKLLAILDNKLYAQNRKLVNEIIDCGTVEFKEILHDDYNIEIPIIDNYTRCLEKLVSTQITKTVQPFINDCTQAEKKEDAEDLLYPINYFYEIQNLDTKNILKYGIEHLKNLKECLKNIDTNTNTDFYIKEILQKSIYPSFNKKQFDFEYNPENKMLIIDYDLPLIEDLNNIKSIKYIVTKNIFSECYFSEKEMQNIYDNLLYEITLRTLAEIFNCVENIDTIIFNGILNYIDKSDGKNKSACIISVQTNRTEFLDINLTNIVPSACFKKLKGISSKALYTITPVRPIMQLNKNDKRFIDAYGVMDDIQEGMNLATMDWQDFENLIREVFEKYFSQDGDAEVKVTQSSRDGGVDAVVFDPDPIRGGKIVIQAKRYTNVVGVSAVRDLYGTVINEGAIKGILVTTADFGSDSHAFVKDKPITLINGSSLLYLLEQYGHKARINIKEAKEYFKNNDMKIHANKSY